MVTFKRAANQDEEVTGTIDLVQGNVLKLKINGIPQGATATHYHIKSNSPLITVHSQANPKRLEQSVDLHISTTGTAKLASISAHHPQNDSIAASFFVNILPKISLPAFNTDVGMMAHLFLAESVTPNYPEDYGDGTKIFDAMELMRQVLDNRYVAANTSKEWFSYVACNPASNNMQGIIQAKKCGGAEAVQFLGFDGARSSPDPKKQKTIHDLLAQANDGSNKFFLKSRRHIEKALEIALRPPKSKAITADSLIYWRTARSETPSPYAIYKKSLGGQDFYALSANYLKNPNNPGERPK